ncbi:hypothetical protein [Streptomyces ipomoeae]|nr:hypothetical protein [Streptomyces ipomoeae]
MVHSVLAVFVSKEPRPPEVFPADGVSTYLALIFGTLLSSQGTDASFVLTRAVSLGLSSGRFPSVFPTLPDPFSVPFPVGIHFRWPLEGLCLFGCLAAPFRRVRLYQKLLAGLTDRSF